MSFTIRVGFAALGLTLFLACGGEAETGAGPEGPAGGSAAGGTHAGESAESGRAGRASGGAANTGGSSNGRGGSGPAAAGRADAGDGNIDAGGSGGGDDPPASPDAVVKIVIAPGGALLTPAEPSRRLAAHAFDADGNELRVEIDWTSNDPDTVTVDADGVVRAEQPAGSALVTATAGDAKATIFVLAATPVDGALVVADEDFAGNPVAEDSSAPFGEGYRYTIELAVEPPATGTILLASGDKPVAGRVVAVAGSRVTLEVVPLDEVFAELRIDETLALEEAPDVPIPDPTAEFKVGPFECEIDRGVVELEFAKKEKRLTGLNTLSYQLIWEDEHRKVEVRGKPGVAFELEPTLAAALNASVTCKVILKEYQIPIPGPAKLFLGAAVVLGAGVKLGGKIPVAGVGVNLKGEVEAELAMGAECVEGECSTLQEIEPEATVTPKLVAPDVSLKFEPEAQAFVYADFEGGARFSSTLRTEAIQAQAGFKLAGSFASEETQAEDDDYASKYELSFEAEVGPGEAVNDFFGLIGFGLSFLKFERSVPLAGSPTGETLATVDTFATGDEVTFNVALEPESVELPVVGYNIEKVRIYRKEVRADGSVSLILANEAIAEEAQTQFAIPWVATLDGSIEDNFLVFVTSGLMELPLELGKAIPAPRNGTLRLFSGDSLVATDGYAVDFPAENPDDPPIRVARIYYGATPDTVLACSKQQYRGGFAFINVFVANTGELTPGTYTFSDWDAAGGPQPGTFLAFPTTQPVPCVTLPEGVFCECGTSDTSGVFTSGELVLNDAEGGVLDGRVTLVTPGYGTSTGTFTMPLCEKTLEEH
ncbi:MAG TPA: hypothetical protein VGK73_33830, partial [Polyangiaceae bacterium]